MDLLTAHREGGSTLMLRRNICDWLGGLKATATGSVDVSVKAAGEERKQEVEREGAYVIQS